MLGGHDLVLANGRWTCRSCWSFSSSRPKLASQRCKGSAVATWAARERDLSAAGGADGPRHVRWLTDGIVWCSLCGSYAVSWAVGLRKTCGGVPSCDGARAVRNHLRAFRHPVTRQPLRGPHVPEPRHLHASVGSGRERWGSHGVVSPQPHGIDPGSSSQRAVRSGAPAVTSQSAAVIRIEAMQARVRERISACSTAAAASACPRHLTARTASNSSIDGDDAGGPRGGGTLDLQATTRDEVRAGMSTSRMLKRRRPDSQSPVPHDTATAYADRKRLSTALSTAARASSPACVSPQSLCQLVVDGTQPAEQPGFFGSAAPVATVSVTASLGATRCSRKRPAAAANLEPRYDALAITAARARRLNHAYDHSLASFATRRRTDSVGVPTSVLRPCEAVPTRKNLLRTLRG